MNDNFKKEEFNYYLMRKIIKLNLQFPKFIYLYK